MRMLANAIRERRIAHAFLFTGVRGVGKTTAARVLARALNCEDGPTPEPCGKCTRCRMILEERDLDVLEIDAASHTSVDELRELLYGARYRPVHSRYRVYIVDEVHMLSRHAFNALLKTLEEPPSHAVFILATTEVRKVPITVVSRCQRFALQRVPIKTLCTHLIDVAGREGCALPMTSATMLARASGGSVRDALSMLDQSIALLGKELLAEGIRKMLGLADRSRTLPLFVCVQKGRIAQALEHLRAIHAAGDDAETILRDLLEITHRASLACACASLLDGGVVLEAEKEHFVMLAENLTVPRLERCWRILLAALEEARFAPDTLEVAEMALIRLTHAGDLPTAAEALRLLGFAEQETGSLSMSGARGSLPTGSLSEGRSAQSVDSVDGPGSLESLPPEIGDHPLLKRALELFPGAGVRRR